MGALVLAGAVTVGLSDPAVEDAVEDLIYNTNMLSGSGFGPADTLAGLLWGVSLFYASPLQQLLLFLGKIETQRPSDWIIMVLARGPLGLPITDVNEAPGWLSGVAAGVCLVSGLAISAVLQFPRYRSQDALTDATLRSLVRNWAPEVDRTPNGFYRGVSLRPRVNEFTGQVEGGSGASTPVASRDPSPTSSVDGEPVATAAGGGAQQP
eukprot:XP_001698961.1 predicted protein [Chlamydomonas reinhardtii]